jgi:hypothetical protein
MDSTTVALLLAAATTIKGILDTGSNVYSAWMQRRQAVALEVEATAMERAEHPIPVARREIVPLTGIDTRSIVVIAILLVLTWSAVGYDIYHHQYAARPTDETWASPHDVKVQWLDFFPSWPLDLENRFSGVTKPCFVKISAVKEQMALRKVLAQIVNENSVCTLVDDLADQDQIPSEYRDIDAMPIPPPGLSIHWNKDAQIHGESIAGWFGGIGFIVNRGHLLPPNAKPTEIWIDIGHGVLWQN